MQPLDANRDLAVRHVDRDYALADDRRLVLADLIALRQIGIEIVLAVEHRPQIDLGLEAEAGADRLAHAFLVDHRQHARHRGIDQRNVRIRRAAEFGRGAGEQLGMRGDLGVHLHADDDLPVAGRALDQLRGLCGHAAASIAGGPARLECPRSNILIRLRSMAEIKVLSSIATREAHLELVPRFERESGQTVAFTWAGTVDIMKRMTAGEVYDLVMMASRELDELIKLGKLAGGSRVELASSGIGVAVRQGAPKPDIGSADALKRAVLAAKTVGFTTGPSGVYMGGLMERMGIAAEIKPKFRTVPSGGTIGTIIASGDCEIGFQQISELVHIPGID